MLEELRIRGLGVIEDAVLPLGAGLTAVTGETGAGKTMVVSGLLLLFGGKADAARVRSGAEQASVDGRLDVGGDVDVAARVRNAGGDLDDDSGLIIRRVVSVSGRSRAHVGGAPVPLAVLGELADHLVAVHGQADQQRLTRPGRQRAALDRFAGLDLVEYQTAYAAWRDAETALTDRTTRLGELRREADLLQHGIAEIETVAPEPGEDAELAAAATRLGHADALVAAAHAAHDLLLGSAETPLEDAADVAGLLGAAVRVLAQQAGSDPALDALAERLVDVATVSADLGADLGAYAEDLDADPAQLARVEQRRAQLQALIRKYAPGPQPDLAAVLQWNKNAAERLAEIDVSDEAIAALVASRDDARDAVAALGYQLSDVRREAASRLAAAVTTELAGLAMAASRIDIAVRPRSATTAGAVLTVAGVDLGVGPDGMDEVEFLLQAHPQSPVLPLARSASGGELSRVMLALELSLAGLDPVPTMVFDEVDAGVGGRAALEVGRRLAQLARRCQVVVVTHLAQVAAYADQHIVVDRAGESGEQAVRLSDVRLVEGGERTAELARMLSGSDSRTALKHAAELLATVESERGSLLKK